MNEELEKNGFVVIDNVFSPQEIASMRQISIDYLKSGNGFRNGGGIAKPSDQNPTLFSPR